MINIDLQVKRIHEKAKLPMYILPGDSGFDLSSVEEVILNPGETKAIKTGLVFQVPTGFEIQIRPRSGVSLKTKLRVSNSPGTIDSPYRGELFIICDNIGDSPITIEVGDRIAQGVLQSVPRAIFIEVFDVDKTERGTNGLGSTGYNQNIST